MKSKSIKQTKILVLSIHPAPYRDPLFNELSSIKNLELIVYNYFENDRGHSFWELSPPKYNQKTLTYPIHISKKYFHIGIIPVLFSKYDYIVIPGWSHYTSIFAIVFSLLFMKKIIMQTDNILERRNNKFSYTLKRYLLRKFSFLWIPGIASEQFHSTTYGIESEKIIKGAYALDEKTINEIHTSNLIIREENRLKYGISNKSLVFLMVANFTPNRNHKLLFETFFEFQKENSNSYLVAIGDGPEKGEIERFCIKHDVRNYSILSNVKYLDLPKYYAMSDVYVHFGSEPYSTAIAIASITGKPIISSKSVGATFDYLVNEETGLLIQNVGSKVDWLSAFESLNEEKIKSYSQKSLELSSRLSIHHYLEDFLIKLDIPYHK
ncbi:MAG: glycosyltransferase [Prolixibacteraceae bacterium]|nr:glycosyltransferase [Prolixibacteraceae bacterium]